MYRHYQALIFDMDGTLFDTEPLHRKAWLSVFAADNITISEEELIPFNGSAPWQVASQLVALKGLRADPFSLAERKKQAIENLLQTVDIQLLPAMKILQQWQGKIPLALGTGSERSTVDILLARFQLTQHFAAIVSADRVKNHKPAADTFYYVPASFRFSLNAAWFLKTHDLVLKPQKMQVWTWSTSIL